MKKMKISCPCGFESEIPKIIVEHMFDNCHAMDEDLCKERPADLMKELEEMITMIQAFPGEIGTPLGEVKEIEA